MHPVNARIIHIRTSTKGNRGAALLLASRCEELAIPIPDTIGKTSFTAKERESTLNRIRQFLEEKKDDLRTLLEFHVKIKEKAVISEYKGIVSGTYYSEGTSYLICLYILITLFAFRFLFRVILEVDVVRF